MEGTTSNNLWSINENTSIGKISRDEMQRESTQTDAQCCSGKGGSTEFHQGVDASRLLNPLILQKSRGDSTWQCSEVEKRLQNWGLGVYGARVRARQSPCLPCATLRAGCRFLTSPCESLLQNGVAVAVKMESWGAAWWC